MLVRIIDDNGFFLRDDFAEEITKNTIETPCPQGFHLPRWNGTEWVEGKTPIELAVIETERKAVERLGTNKLSIEDYLKQAIADNKTYLALTTPTTAQNTAQIKKLTRQNNRLIRLITNLLESVE